MREGIGFWLVILVLVALHFLLHLGFGIGRAAPDLLTVAVLLAARTGGVGRGAGIGFFFGLLEDAFSVLAFGANAVAMTLIGAFGALTRDLFVGESVLFYVGYLTVGAWLRDLVAWLVMGDAIREPFVEAVLVHATVSAVYAAAVGLLVVLVTGGPAEATT